MSMLNKQKENSCTFLIQFLIVIHIDLEANAYKYFLLF